nr:leucyl/phenylalanyl-tRNA--protein transferase [Gloeothece verrucosa]
MIWDVESIIQAYAQGYFLMSDEDGTLGWYTSRQRTLIPLDDRFRYPRSLQRVLNQQKFTVAINRDFPSVCAACADRETTWISGELIDIYLQLHQAGWAFSFETWLGDQLAGGILGIVIRGAFIGESMFYRIPDGSKVAMVKLVEHLKQRGFVLFDAQLQNPHLARFGSYCITDREYQVLLKRALSHKCFFS